jgi:hypothetical protein
MGFRGVMMKDGLVANPFLVSLVVIAMTVVTVEVRAAGSAADPSPIDIMQRLDKIKEQQRLTEAKQKQAAERVAQLKSTLKDMRKQLGDADQAFRRVLNGPGGTDTTESINELEAKKKRLLELKAQVDSVDADLAKAQAEVSTYGTQLSDLDKQAAPDRAKAGLSSFQNALLRAQIDNVTLQGKLNQAQAQNLGNDKTLDLIASEYGRQSIGKYVRDKIGLLVNSQFICEVRTRCDAPKTKAIPIKPEKIDEIFPEMKSVQQRGSYHPGVPAQSAQ